ncbi:MAG: GumC family protein [Gemmatimonadaceae bacterium]
MPVDLVQSSGGGVQPYGNGAAVSAWQQPPVPAAPAESSMLGNALHRTIAALKRYKWLILATTVFGSAVGFVMSKMIAPKYQVNASVWIREQNLGGPIQPPGMVSTNLSWADLVMSQAVLDSVVVRLALFAMPQTVRDTVVMRSMQPTDTLIPGAYQLAVKNGRYVLTRTQGPRGEDVNAVVEQGVVGDSVGRAIGISWLPDWSLIPRDRDLRFNVGVPREASGRILRQLQVILPPQSNFMRMNLSGPEPVLLASTMNTILDVFLETAKRLKRTDLTETYESLEAQRQKAAADMASTAKQLEGYRIRTITLPSDQVPVAPGVMISQNPVFNSYFNDRTSLSNIKQDRELLEEVLNERKAGGTGWIEKLRLLVPTLQLSNPNLNLAIGELDLARNRLRIEMQTKTDSNPAVIDLRKKIRQLEMQDVPQLTQVSLNQMRSRERDLGNRVRLAGKELEQIPSRSIEEDRLNRNYQVAVSVYNELHNRTINAKLAESSVQPDVSVLERAVPPGRPSTDTASAIFLMAIAGSLAAGILLALMLDRIDKRFRYPEQAVGELGLDILGAIPSFKNPKNSAARLEEWSQLMEAFRSLGLSVRSAFPQNEPIAFTISSPGPGDGKSFISLNLSMVMAEAGFRTVLIDGDIRRGRLHETKPLIDCSQSPGLVEHLAGEATLAEVIRETTHANLCVIPCGARRRQGPELLASEAMQRLIAELRAQFDAIIVDSAPLAAGIDPYALGAASGAMLVVLRAGETDTKLAQAKLGTIDRLPVRLIGSVLNDVGTDATYRYYSYLGYEYAPMDDAESPGLIGSAKE